MTVNNIELAVGQTWRTRGGKGVEIVGYDAETNTPFVWDLSNEGSVTDEGREWGDENDPGDLITLIQDEHGFIPWNGGECPVGDFTSVEYKMRAYDDTDIDSACSLEWEHGNNSTDIIAYRVVKQEVKPTKVDVEKEDQPKQEEESVVEQKYTVEQVFEAIQDVWGYHEDFPLIVQIKDQLAKTQDPDYKLYLELKAKFE